MIYCSKLFRTNSVFSLHYMQSSVALFKVKSFTNLLGNSGFIPSSHVSLWFQLPTLGYNCQLIPAQHINCLPTSGTPQDAPVSSFDYQLLVYLGPKFNSQLDCLGCLKHLHLLFLFSVFFAYNKFGIF